MAKHCILEEDKLCNHCGDCDRCDLDHTKICDNCGKCLETGSDSNAVLIDGIDLGGFWEGDWNPEEEEPPGH